MTQGTGQAQNKLGELFVDLGVGGVGKALKALNTVSATFLLTKNTAQQLIKPIVEMGKQSLNSAVEIGKLSASFGTTLIEAQKFAYYLKEKNLSEGLLSDMQSLQTKFTRIRAGFEGVDGQMAMSMNMLGLDWQNYDGSAQSMLQYVKDVQNAVKGMNANEARMHLQNLGLGNTDWLYAFQRGDFNLRDALGIDDQLIKNLIKADEQLNRMGNNLDRFKKNLTNKAIEKGGIEALETANEALEGDKNAKKRLKNAALHFGAKAAISADPVLNAAENNYLLNQNKNLKTYFEIIKAVKNSPLKNDLKKRGGSVTGEAAPIDFGTNPLSNLNTMPNQNIEITNQMTINGENAQEIADKVASINSQQLQYNQYQSYNMAGL